MSSIPNQNLFGVPIQSGYVGNQNPWGAPGYTNVASAGIATGTAAAYGTGSAETSALPPLSDADRAGLEAQALNGFLQQAAASSIRKLFHYLESNSPAYPQLNAQLPVLTQAVDAYRTGNFPQAFTLAFQVFRAIVLFQSLNRELPSIPAS
jgi:hypothetical protein